MSTSIDIRFIEAAHVNKAGLQGKPAGFYVDQFHTRMGFWDGADLWEGAFPAQSHKLADFQPSATAGQQALKFLKENAGWLAYVDELPSDFMPAVRQIVEGN